MKTSFIRLSASNFCKALLVAALNIAGPVNNAVSMPGIRPAHFVPVPVTDSNTADQLRALTYTVVGKPLIVVHLENPQVEQISILILDNKKQPVFTKELGKPENYVSRFNLQELPDGEYTFVVKSATYTYTKAFSLKTSTQRMISAEPIAEMDREPEAI